MVRYLLCVLSFASVAVSGKIVYPCITPKGEHAYCRSLFSCPHMMMLLGEQEPAGIDFVKKSICLGCSAGDFMVCCGTTENRTQEPNVSSYLDTETITVDPNEPPSKGSRNESVKLLPALKFCGYQHTDDRIYNDTATALDEFPWLVHIMFTDLQADYEFADRCNGVLISKRYVLTDAYCGAEAIKVKLGQHITNKNESCIDDPYLPECSDPTYELRVEEKIRDGRRENGPYDFTLLRLDKKVTFTGPFVYQLMNPNVLQNTIL